MTDLIKRNNLRRLKRSFRNRAKIIICKKKKSLLQKNKARTSLLELRIKIKTMNKFHKKIVMINLEPQLSTNKKILFMETELTPTQRPTGNINKQIKRKFYPN